MATQHSPADIVAQLMIDLGLFQDPAISPLGAWPVYATNEPTTPDNVLTVQDTDHMYHGRTQPDGITQGPQGIQFRLRSKTHKVGWTKADILCERIQSRTGGCYRVDVTLEGVRYHIQSFCSISDVIPLGKESPTSSRRVFVINCGVLVDQCSS